MSWRESLRAASFRGTTFEVEGADYAGGRRVALHEYAQKDKPYAEDMGRKAREINVTAFVIGPDYMTRRDALLAALEGEGPGELVHPYYGAIQVSCTALRVRESRDEGGMARFELSLVESGELVFPASSKATGDKVTSASATALSKLKSLFAERWSLAGLPDWAQRAAGNDVTNVLASARSLVAQADSSWNWLGQFDERTASVQTQTSNATALSGTFASALTPPATVTSTTAKADALGPVTRWAAPINPDLAQPATVAANDPVTLQAAKNATAIRALTRGTLLANGASKIAATDVTAYQDAIAARRAITRAIDDEMSTTDSDAQYQAWADLRAAVHEDLTTRARKAARLKTVTPAETTPALALAYDLYENSGRDGEIVVRNAIRHPAFVPPEPVLVLNA